MYCKILLGHQKYLPMVKTSSCSVERHIQRRLGLNNGKKLVNRANCNVLRQIEDSDTTFIFNLRIWLTAVKQGKSKDSDIVIVKISRVWRWLNSPEGIKFNTENTHHKFQHFPQRTDRWAMCSVMAKPQYKTLTLTLQTCGVTFLPQ
jgi:hypothetical protein